MSQDDKINDITQEASKSSQDNTEVDQEDPQPLTTTATMTASAKKENQRALRSYDRLLPRYCDEPSRKRKSATDQDPGPSTKKPNASSGAKKEYSKLKTLVPALTEREDLSKVEIIEETIRYIDALHHQLATRGLNPSASEGESETVGGSNAESLSSESNPENSSPLKALLSASDGSLAARLHQRRSLPSTSSSSAGSSAGTSSSDRSSSGDVKAAVENIQAMFAAYLEHQRSSSSDESTS